MCSATYNDSKRRLGVLREPTDPRRLGDGTGAVGRQETELHGGIVAQ